MIKLPPIRPWEYRRLTSDVPVGYHVLLTDHYQVMSNESVLDAMSETPSDAPVQYVTVRRELLCAPRGILRRPEIRGRALFRTLDSERDDEVEDLGTLRQRTFCYPRDGRNATGEALFTQAQLAHRAFLRLQPGEFVRLRFWIWYYTVLRIQ